MKDLDLILKSQSTNLRIEKRLPDNKFIVSLCRPTTNINIINVQPDYVKFVGKTIIPSLNDEGYVLAINSDITYSIRPMIKTILPHLVNHSQLQEDQLRLVNLDKYLTLNDQAFAYRDRHNQYLIDFYMKKAPEPATLPLSAFERYIYPHFLT